MLKYIVGSIIIFLLLVSSLSLFSYFVLIKRDYFLGDVSTKYVYITCLLSNFFDSKKQLKSGEHYFLNNWRASLFINLIIAGFIFSVFLNSPDLGNNLKYSRNLVEWKIIAMKTSSVFCLFLAILFQLSHLVYAIFSQKKDYSIARLFVLFIISYLTCGFAFSALYIQQSHCLKISCPGHMVIDYTYFSFTTLSTTGLGDIIPKTSYAKILINIENLFGLFYTSYLIGIIVTLGLRENKN